MRRDWMARVVDVIARLRRRAHSLGEVALNSLGTDTDETQGRREDTTDDGNGELLAPVTTQWWPPPPLRPEHRLMRAQANFPLPFSAVAVGVSLEVEPDATRPKGRRSLPCRFGSEPEGVLVLIRRQAA
jgi:hypothetical protein